MATLSSAQRSTLERAVVKARDAAEGGVRKRFASLDLTASEAPAGIAAADRALRTGLRRRAIQLG